MDSHRQEAQELQNDKTIYYVDGKRVNKAEADAIDPSHITSVNVWKGKKAVIRHGEEARDGVVEIVTNTHAAKNEANPKEIVGKPGKDFYIIDDKAASKAEAAKLDVARVETVDVWTAEKPVAKYNIESNDLVVDIVTKKQPAAGETPSKVYVVGDKPTKVKLPRQMRCALKVQRRLKSKRMLTNTALKRMLSPYKLSRRCL